MLKSNELKVNRSLLNKDFEGYKLSLSPVPVYQEPVPNGVHVVHPSEDQFSFLHQRLFSLHNHLIADPWNDTAVYFFADTRKIRRSWIGQNGRLENTVEVMELPPTLEAVPDKYNASMSFPSKDTCLIADGAGSIYLVDTSNRSLGDVVSWKILYQGKPIGNVGFMICDTRMQSDHLTKVCHCVVQYITPVPPELSEPNKKTPGYETVLTWLVISEEIDGRWNVDKEELRGSGPVDYVAVEPNTNGIYVVSEVPFRSRKTEEEQTKPTVEEGIDDDPLYDFEWQQTYDDIKLWLPLPDSHPSKNNVNVVAKSSELIVSYKGETILTGKLPGVIDPLLTTWSVSDHKLEITLQKYLEGTMWPNFMECEKKGKELIDPAVTEEVNARLAHLTSDKEEEAGPVMNEGMEECDASGGESRTLMRFERNSLVCTNKVHLGYQQWILSVKLEADQVPAFCIRNDVDGCVWAPESSNVTTGEWKVEHVGTLLAFGYVQASKTNRKFSVVPPDLSYVAIVEVTGHVIVYKKGVSINTTLRNRRTGRQLKEIAVQQLVNLHTTSSILGAVATDQFLFVLTKDSLHLLHVAS